MIIRGTSKGFFRTNTYEFDTQKNSISVFGDNAENSIAYLMRKMIRSGVSVVVYSNTDYYYHVHDVVTPYVMTTGYSEIVRDCRVPYIVGSCAESWNRLKECFYEYGMSAKFSYMERKDEGQAFYDPGKYQSYYQIKKGNIEKERFYTESLILNIVSQCLYTEGIHEVALFIDMPYKPVTTTMLNVLEAAHRGYISLVCVYKNECNISGTHRIHADGQKMILEARNGSFLLENEE